jgi:hypothetical protein
MTGPKANQVAGAADDAVGCRKAPLHTKIRKGQAGHSAGRPSDSARLCAKQLTAGQIFKIP